MFETLRAAYDNNWVSLQEKANQTLEPLELTKMEQNIIIARMKKLAKDPACSFANALDLVHKSYSQQDWERQSEIGDIVRPGYADKNAWKQYEEFIELAVTLLAQYRGVNGDWRTNAFASVPTNDRASMGSMMAAKVGESAIIKWKSSEPLNMIAESYDPSQGLLHVDCLFDTIELALESLITECEKKKLVIVHNYDEIGKSVLEHSYNYDILDGITAKVIDQVTVQYYNPI